MPPKKNPDKDDDDSWMNELTGDSNKDLDWLSEKPRERRPTVSGNAPSWLTDDTTTNVIPPGNSTNNTTHKLPFKDKHLARVVSESGGKSTPRQGSSTSHNVPATSTPRNQPDWLTSTTSTPRSANTNSTPGSNTPRSSNTNTNESGSTSTPRPDWLKDEPKKKSVMGGVNSAVSGIMNTRGRSESISKEPIWLQKENSVGSTDGLMRNKDKAEDVQTQQNTNTATDKKPEWLNSKVGKSKMKSAMFNFEYRS